MSLKFNPFNGEFIPGSTATAPVSPNSIQNKTISGSPEDGKSLVFNSQTDTFEHKANYVTTNVLDFIPSSEHRKIRNRTSFLDVSSHINAAIASVATTGGTLFFPDGTYCIGSPIIALRKVSLHGACRTTTIKALPSFTWSHASFPRKSIIKTVLDDTNGHWENNSIKNFTLHGGNVAEMGIELIRARFCYFDDIDIYGCVEGGIYSGTSTVSSTYGNNFNSIYIWRFDVLATPTSVGFTFRNTTDNYLTQVTVQGYYIGFKSFEGSGGNHLIQCHCWNRPANGPLKYGFWCGGPNDHYSLCYADTPIDGTNDAYGFYVDASSQKITDGFVFNSAQPGYGADNTVIGIFCSSNSSAASGCCFSGNTFFGGGPTARIRQDIAGEYFLAEINSNTSNTFVGFSIGTRMRKGILFASGGNTSFDFSIRDTGTGFDNIVALNPFPSGNGNSTSTTPGSTNKATVAFFNQTSTSSDANIDIYNAAAVLDANGQRFTTVINHRLSANAVNPNYFGILNNTGFGTRTPGARVQVTGGLVVTANSNAASDPGAGMLRTEGLILGYRTATASGTMFSRDYYVNCDATTGNQTQTLVAANTQAAGREVFFKKIDSTANTVTITAAPGNTIEGAASKVLTTQYSSIRLYTNGSNAWFIS